MVKTISQLKISLWQATVVRYLLTNYSHGKVALYTYLDNSKIQGVM